MGNAANNTENCIIVIIISFSVCMFFIFIWLSITTAAMMPPWLLESVLYAFQISVCILEVLNEAAYFAVILEVVEKSI